MEDIEKIYKIFLNSEGINFDTRILKNNEIFFALSSDKNDGNIFAEEALKKGAVLAIIDNPKYFQKLKIEYPKKIILVENSLKTLQNLAKYHRSKLNIPILGITGSNGKTTTKELVKNVLSKKYNVLATSGNLNNHIGVPITILSIKPENDFGIIEMGANHIGEIKILAEIAKPNFGIITNIGLAHIGEFGSFENIKKTKKELYDEVLKNKGKIFYNPDDRILSEIAQQFHSKNKIPYLAAKILDSKEFLKIKINDQEIQTKLVGEYNLFNLQAATTIGKFFGVTDEKIKKALENYQPKNNRSQKEVTEKENEIIWDCYNANPSSMGQAIKSFLKNNPNKKIFILGDMKELGKYSESEHEKILNQLLKIKGKKFLVGNEFLRFQKKFSQYKDFKFFKNVLDLENFLKKENLKKTQILVKGSNSIQLFNLQNKKIL